MTSSPLDAFLRKWRNAGGAERANAQPFLCDLCELLGVPGLEPHLRLANPSSVSPK